MPRFYFDFDDGRSIIDTDGEEFPDIESAKKEAVISLGEYARDYTRSGAQGRILVRVRDEHGPVIEVAATIEAKVSERGC